MNKDQCEIECGAYGTYCKCNDEAAAKSSRSPGLLCADCGFDIKPPLGKPFSNGDGKTRCASCATDFWMKHPGATAEIKTAAVLKSPGA